jgi:hypothetical protein
MLARGPEVLTEAGTATVHALESIRAVGDAPDLPDARRWGGQGGDHRRKDL